MGGGLYDHTGIFHPHQMLITHSRKELQRRAPEFNIFQCYHKVDKELQTESTDIP